jgi:hypothetical protein
MAAIWTADGACDTLTHQPFRNADMHATTYVLILLASDAAIAGALAKVIGMVPSRD